MQAKHILSIASLLCFSSIANAAPKDGWTFEANIGTGVISDGAETTAASAGLDLSVGRFLSPKLAVMLRAAGGSDKSFDYTQVFLGPSVQYWTSRNLWVGGGLGFGSLFNGGNQLEGLGVDARVGYTLNPGSTHSLNLSLELTRTQFGGSAATLGAVLIGWQML